ncbi:MAG: hypothetical protein KAJ07_00500 [Planctomycetes bacterium]|nr:hypothetical protein [Planctomycetota bacterium]
MADGALFKPPLAQFMDSNGNPISNGKVYFYEPGTSTLKDTYQEEALVTPHANPVRLDGNGAAEIWLDGLYKVNVTTSLDTQVTGYPVDNVSSSAAITAAVISEWSSPADVPTFISSTQFTVPDDKRTTYQIGRRLKSTATAGTLYNLVTAVSFASGTTTVTVSGDNLDSGLSVVDVGILTATNPSIPKIALELEDATSLIHAVTAQQINSGELIYGADTGAADVYVVALAPAPTVHTTGMKVGTKIVNANLTTTPTLNVSGLGAGTIKLPGGAALRVGDLPVGHLAWFERDGTDWILLNPALGIIIGIVGEHKNLVILNNTGTPNSQLDIDADAIILEDSSGANLKVTGVNLTADITASGVNGLDTGSEANSTWYHAWVIYNPTTDTTAALLSISSTAPTLPSGYTFKALMGAIFNDSGGNFIGYEQRDKSFILTSVINLADGSLTINAWTLLSAITAFPPTAKKVLVVWGGSTGDSGFSHRSDGEGGHYHRAADAGGTEDYGVLTTARGNNNTQEIWFDGTNIYYWVANAAGTIDAIGGSY